MGVSILVVWLHGWFGANAIVLVIFGDESTGGGIETSLANLRLQLSFRRHQHAHGTRLERLSRIIVGDDKSWGSVDVLACVARAVSLVVSRRRGLWAVEDVDEDFAAPTRKLALLQMLERIQPRPELSLTAFEDVATEGVHHCAWASQQICADPLAGLPRRAEVERAGIESGLDAEVGMAILHHPVRVKAAHSGAGRPPRDFVNRLLSLHLLMMLMRGLLRCPSLAIDVAKEEDEANRKGCNEEAK